MGARAAQGNALRRYEAIETDITGAPLDFLVQNLCLLSQAIGLGFRGKTAQLGKNGNRKVEKPLAIADKISPRIHGQTIGDQQTDRSLTQLLHRNPATVLGKSLIPNGIGQVLEGYFVWGQKVKPFLQARRGHQQLLAIGQGVDPDLLQSCGGSDEYPFGLPVFLKTPHQLRGLARGLPFRRSRKIRPHCFLGNHDSTLSLSTKKAARLIPVGFACVLVGNCYILIFFFCPERVNMA